MRTLKDYRPQHGSTCASHRCAKCGQRHKGKHILWRTVNFHDFDPPACTCGLDALLTADPVDPRLLLSQIREQIALKVYSEEVEIEDEWVVSDICGWCNQVVSHHDQDCPVHILDDALSALDRPKESDNGQSR